LNFFKDIPPELTERLALERNIETNRRKDKFEAHMYTNVRIITDDVFISNQVRKIECEGKLRL